ncbi:hypothetical protein COLO4_13072 [Corchorus olitorius]|uniref:Uncharacterized protein n=1 Tax=Corchorus olitorius TaxID=93759 RepID=A0A1R3JYF1_9ROSI|nr:hypothetical protein COLO4_13072 [Corchorus olitorius]
MCLNRTTNITFRSSFLAITKDSKQPEPPSPEPRLFILFGCYVESPLKHRGLDSIRASLLFLREGIVFMEERERFRGVKSVRGRDLERGRVEFGDEEDERESGRR